jgi:hypothetical protein
MKKVLSVAILVFVILIGMSASIYASGKVYGPEEYRGQEIKHLKVYGPEEYHGQEIKSYKVFGPEEYHGQKLHDFNTN